MLLFSPKKDCLPNISVIEYEKRKIECKTAAYKVIMNTHKLAHLYKPYAACRISATKNWRRNALGRPTYLAHRLPRMDTVNFSVFSSSSILLPHTHLQYQRRFETTGEYHEYKPGPIARAVRALFVTCTPSAIKKWMAGRLTAGMEKVEKMEKEQQWLKTHGSPLKVMGLPEHAELAEVKSRYTDLLFITHPDTAVARTFGRRDAATQKLERDMMTAIKADDGKSSPPSNSEMVTTNSDSRKASQVPDGNDQLKQQRKEELERFEVVKAEKMRAEEYTLLQEAYAMINTPDSVWHLNGSAPHILDVIRPPQTMLAQIATPVRVAFTASQIVGASAVVFLLFVVVPFGLQKWLEFVDPELVRFTEEIKKEDEARAAAGQIVDPTDAARYASPKVQRLLAPGKTVQSLQLRHMAEDEEEVNHVFQALKTSIARSFPTKRDML